MLLLFLFLQGSIEEGPHSPSSDVVTVTNDKGWTPSVTPDSKLKISSPQVKKKQQHKKYSLDPFHFDADFEAFVCANIDHVTREHPELSTKAVEKYLAKEWNEMDDQQKSM